jgi:hypothetical protein
MITTLFTITGIVLLAAVLTHAIWTDLHRKPDDDEPGFDDDWDLT